jgi:hypothetical protein
VVGELDRAGEPAAGEGEVHVELVSGDQPESGEAGFEEFDVFCGCAFLGSKDDSCALVTEEWVGDVGHEVELGRLCTADDHTVQTSKVLANVTSGFVNKVPAESAEGSGTGVGGGGSAKAEVDVFGSGFLGGEDELADTVGGCLEGSERLGGASKAAGLGDFDVSDVVAGVPEPVGVDALLGVGAVDEGSSAGELGDQEVDGVEEAVTAVAEGEGFNFVFLAQDSGPGLGNFY